MVKRREQNSDESVLKQSKLALRTSVQVDIQPRDVFDGSIEEVSVEAAQHCLVTNHQHRT